MHKECSYMAGIFPAMGKDFVPKYHEPAGVCDIHTLYTVEGVK
jgi:hypothetical protein